MEHVTSGQELTTGLINGIIDLASGQNIPTNDGFQKTNKGTLFINSTDLKPQVQAFDNSKFLECKICKSAKLKKRPNEYDEENTFVDYMFINLAKDYETAKSLITYNNEIVDAIYIFNGKNKDLDIELGDELFTRNSYSTFVHSRTGYINTGIEIENRTTVNVWASLVKIIPVAKDEKEKHVFVISDYKDVEGRVQTFSDGAEKTLLVVQKPLFYTTTLVGNSTVNFIQGIIGGQDYSLGEVIPVDSQLSDITLSSLQLESIEISTDVNYTDEDGNSQTSVDVKDKFYHQIYKFGKGNEINQFEPSYKPEDDTDYTTRLDGYDAFLIRKCKSYDNEARGKPELDEANVAYMSFMSLSNYINYVGDSDIYNLDDYENGMDNGDLQQSIEWKYIDELHQNYFSLYKWTDDTAVQEKTFEIGSHGEEFNLLNFGNEDSDDPPPQFLTRKYGRQGCSWGWTLEYTDLKCISPDMTYIEDWLNDISTVISGDTQRIYEKINELSGEYWEQGSTYVSNYGSSIGSDKNTEVINLVSRVLWGNWQVKGGLDQANEGNLFVENNIECYNLDVEERINCRVLSADIVEMNQLSVNESITIKDITIEKIDSEDSLHIDGALIVRDGFMTDNASITTLYIHDELDIGSGDVVYEMDSGTGCYGFTVNSSFTVNGWTTFGCVVNFSDDISIMGQIVGCGLVDIKGGLWVHDDILKTDKNIQCGCGLTVASDAVFHNSVTVNGSIIGCGNILECAGSFEADSCSVSDYIKIGNTQITEEQLQQLLALLPQQ